MKRENISKAFQEENKILNEECKKKTIMKEIELKTEKKINEAFQTNQITNPILENNKNLQQNNQDTLQSILINSSIEFREKMGRNMTYSEMREMYG